MTKKIKTMFFIKENIKTIIYSIDLDLLGSTHVNLSSPQPKL
jgi:hypothetical protein